MNSQASIEPCSATATAEIAELNVRLVALANAGDWSELAVAMWHRDELLGEVAVNDRAVVFTSVLHCNERVSSVVNTARQSVADQLTTIRRGRDMTGRYELHRADTQP